MTALPPDRPLGIRTPLAPPPPLGSGSELPLRVLHSLLTFDPTRDKPPTAPVRQPDLEAPSRPEARAVAPPASVEPTIIRNAALTSTPPSQPRPPRDDWKPGGYRRPHRLP